VSLNLEDGNPDRSVLRDSKALPSVNPTEILGELCVLLEEYAPSWYSEKQRKRVLAALRFPTDVLVELCALLEDYAPSWYSEEKRNRALAALQGLGLLEQRDRPAGLSQTE
jgi:hypothetical protein